MLMSRARVGQVLSQNLAIEGTEPIREGDLIRIDYMKIAEGRAADYYNMERDDYRPLHAQRIKDGGMKRWSLFAVRLPIGENRTYDAYTTQVFPVPGRRLQTRILRRWRNAAGPLAS